MSKRFGRNQKRRLMRELAQQQEMSKAYIAISVDHVSEIASLQAQLIDSKAVLGAYNPAFPATCKSIERPLTVDHDYAVQLPNGAYARPMTMVMQERPFDHREQAHVILTHKGSSWGYAITDEALHRYPREVLAKRIAHGLTRMVLDQLNELGVRR